LRTIASRTAALGIWEALERLPNRVAKLGPFLGFQGAHDPDADRLGGPAFGSVEKFGNGLEVAATGGVKNQGRDDLGVAFPRRLGKGLSEPLPQDLREELRPRLPGPALRITRPAALEPPGVTGGKRMFVSSTNLGVALIG